MGKARRMGGSLDRKALSAVRLRFGLCHALNALIVLAVVDLWYGNLVAARYSGSDTFAKAAFPLIVILVVWLLFRIERHGIRLLEFSRKLAERKPGTIYELGYLALKDKGQTKTDNRQKSSEELQRRIESLKGDKDGGPA